MLRLSYNHPSGIYSRLDVCFARRKTYLDAANDKKQDTYVSADFKIGYMNDKLTSTTLYI